MGAAFDRSDWESRADFSAFLGNTLLSAMSSETSFVLDDSFWGGLPTFGDASVSSAIGGVRAAVASVRDESERLGRDADEICAVEFARLFIGPPSPAALPWESMCRFGATCGFGEATFDMRRRLREVGLGVGGEKRQYEDHMGIELLLLSVLCRRVADALSESASDAATEGTLVAMRSVDGYIAERPGAWSDRFAESVAEAAPGGYYAAIARLVDAFLKSFNGVCR